MDKIKNRDKILSQFLRCPVFVTNSSIGNDNLLCNEDVPGNETIPQAEEVQRFWECVRSGETDTVRDILDQFPNLVASVANDKSSPIHVAILEKQAAMVALLLDYGKGLDNTDAEGNAPLHLAAMENHTGILDILLQYGAASRVKNSAGDTPLHTAVRSGSLEALIALLKDSRVNVDEKGWKGETALHVAASLNRLECAKALVGYQAQVNQPSDTGERPLHRAADCGSTALLKYLLEVPGLPFEQLLRVTDDEDATPLHLAVNSADKDTVKLLLEHDAPIDAQMFELSTPLHLACAQGFTEIVELIHMFNVVEFDRVVRMKDGQGMTPMHRAAMFNYWGLLRILAEKRASINAQDGNGRSVLVLAASCGAWDSVSELLNCGADPFLCSDDGQNFLHQVVALGGNPETFKEDIRTPEKFVTLLNGKDLQGTTPLHIAAGSGFGGTCETIIKLGGRPTAKDELLRTALHLAAANGRYNTVLKLLSSLPGAGVVNETDAMGLTALHLAAEKGHVKVVSLLISKGALMLRDFRGLLSLHLACREDQEDTAKAVLSAFPLLLDAADKEGNTALHHAADNNAFRCVKLLLDRGARLELNDQQLLPVDLAIVGNHKAAATTMVENPRWREILLTNSTLYQWPVLGLVEQLPSVMLKVLDRSQTPKDSNSHLKDYAVTYDFEMLEPSSNVKSAVDKKESQPLEVANHMVRYRRMELLRHPVCSAYLDTKWLAYGVYFHIVTLLLYVVFVTLLTYLVLVGIESDLRPHLRGESMRRVKKYLPDFNATRLGPVLLTMEEGENTEVDNTLLALAVMFAVLNLAKKIFQLIRQARFPYQDPEQNLIAETRTFSGPVTPVRSDLFSSSDTVHRQRLAFFLRLMNWFELTLYFTTLVFCTAFYDEQDYYLSWQSQWLVGAVAIFFTWVNLFFYLQRYGEVGVHVIILLRVMRTLVEAMCVFFVVVVAFSLTFTVLNPTKILPDDARFYNQSHDSDKLEDVYFTSYSTLQTSILRVSDQMVGNADVIVNFIGPILNKLMIFPNATYIFAMVSIAIITMLVQSLVVGLALGDTDDIIRSLALRRKAMQGVIHYLTDKGARVHDGTLPKKETNWEQNGAVLREELAEQTKLTDELLAKLEQQQEMFSLMTRQLGMQTDGDVDEG